MNRRIAIITGESRGLGKNAALKLAERGVDVIFTYHSRQAEADAVATEIMRLGGKGVALPLDVGNSAMFGAFSERVKVELTSNWQRSTFDFLVNNAGSGIRAPFRRNDRSAVRSDDEYSSERGIFPDTVPVAADGRWREDS